MVEPGGTPSRGAEATGSGSGLLAAAQARADRFLAMVLLAHFPLALALAALNGTWVPALVVGGGVSLALLITILLLNPQAFIQLVGRKLTPWAATTRSTCSRRSIMQDDCTV